MLDLVKKAKQRLEDNPGKFALASDLFEAIRLLEKDNTAHEYNRFLRKLTAEQTRQATDGKTAEKFYHLHKKTLLFDAPRDLDAYLQYVEIDREPEKRFYLPRRKVLLPIVQALQDIEDDKLDLLAISQPPGTGKLLADSTPVLTTNGWKQHGDLKVGDRVFNEKGETVRVTHVFSKNRADYLVTFSNGEQIKCHGEHEWVLYDRGKQKERIVETKYLATRKLDSGPPNKRGHRYVFQLPHRKPIQGEKKDLPVDPYVLGVWLGDGTTKKPAITTGVQDEFILDEVAKHYPISAYVVHKDTGCPTAYYQGLRADLRKLGMCHSRKKYPKYIPEQYLVASLEQRLDLLAGLLDTDGTYHENKYSFSTVSPELRDGVIELVSTFGWRAHYSTYEPKLSSGRIQGRNKVYTVRFSPSFKIPCRVPRKRMDSPSKKRKVSVVSVEPCSPEPGNCISVEGGTYLVGKQMVTTHNSTLGIFFLTWIMGKYPDKPNLASAHSSKLTRSFYDGVYSILTDPEYLWAEVFPGVKLIGTNSKDETLDLDKPKRFKSLTCRSIDGSLTGATRCEKILYADDLVSGIEEALSMDRMDSLWGKYTNDLKSRKKLGCKEVHIATRWSVHDPIGRLKRQYEGDPRARFVSLAALDGNDESNFDYKYGVGFSTKYFHDMRKSLDDVSWRCLFMNEPIEREGLVYHEDELRRYFELPDGEPDAILAVCDTKDRGTDHCVLPVGYMYGKDIYIEDAVVNNGLPEIVDNLCVDILLRHKVQRAQFESNSAGGKTADVVQERLKAKNGITHITKKWTKSNKETRIIINSAYVKEHFLFKDRTKYTPQSDYGKLITKLCSYSIQGKNKEDDVPDALALFAEFVQSLDAGKVEVFQRPF